MSMKHEYEVGQPVWCVVDDYPGLDLGDSAIVEGIDGIFVNIKHKGNRKPVHHYALSPYPPVKAVDGWAVVDEEGNVSHIYLHGDQPNTNSDGWKMFYNNKRLVKGRFIPDNDNS